MCYQTRQSIPADSWSAEPEAVLSDPQAERGWRFRKAALPHLNAVYTMACYLTRDTAEAEYAVQECYVRGLRGFDRDGEDALKPRLLGILRDFCRTELRARGTTLAHAPLEASEKSTSPPGSEPSSPAQLALVCPRDDQTLRRLIADLSEEFRETIVLRDIIQLPYRDVAKVLGISVGAVLARLAGARSKLSARLHVGEGAAP
jgi:RNA polymerase sigma-70 factor (ECF subfamily)